jgi:hypothetical protein
MAASIVLGVIWGLLGVLFASRVFGLFRNDNENLRNFVLLDVFGVVFGMIIGVSLASMVWSRQPHTFKKIAARFVEVLKVCLTCVICGVLIGTMAASIAAVILGILTWDYFGPLMIYAPIYGLLMSLTTVFPVAPLMAPVTVVVWEKTLEWLESRDQHNPNQS